MQNMNGWRLIGDEGENGWKKIERRRGDFWNSVSLFSSRKEEAEENQRGGHENDGDMRKRYDLSLASYMWNLKGADTMRGENSLYYNLLFFQNSLKRFHSIAIATTVCRHVMNKSRGRWCVEKER